MLMLERSPENGSLSFVSVPNYRDWSAERRTLTAMGAWTSVPMTLATEGGRERVMVGRVSGNFFAVLGTPAVAGRVLRSGDEGFSRAVISFDLWERLGGSSTVIGRPFGQ